SHQPFLHSCTSTGEPPGMSVMTVKLVPGPLRRLTLLCVTADEDPSGADAAGGGGAAARGGGGGAAAGGVGGAGWAAGGGASGGVGVSVACAITSGARWADGGAVTPSFAAARSGAAVTAPSERSNDNAASLVRRIVSLCFSIAFPESI